MSSQSHPLLFVAWTPISGRSAEIAEALGGEAYCVFDDRLTRRWLVPLRYALSAARTVRYLRRRRPSAIIVTNPPILPGLLALIYGSRREVPVVLDSHPGGFGAQGDRVSGRLQAIHRWLARRVTASMVTDDHWIGVLKGWGALGIIVHEAPPTWSVKPAGPINGRPRVLFAGTFGGDEPVDVVFGAARMCPEIDFDVTGDPRRCSPQRLESLPSNVRLTGFLPTDQYAAAMERADVVLTLSTEPTSVMRAAYEAVYSGRPLVLSDWPGLRLLFPSAIAVENSADDLARGLRRAIGAHDELLAVTHSARAAQEARWESQLATLRAVLVPEVPPAKGDRHQMPCHEGKPCKNEKAGPPADSVSPTKIASIPISRPTWDEIEEWVSAQIKNKRSATICTVAPYQGYLLLRDPDYRTCLDEASMVLIDGNGIRLVVAVAGVNPGPRMTGREFAERAVTGRILSNVKVAVIGGLPATVERLRDSQPTWLVIDDQLPGTPTSDQVGSITARLKAHDSEFVFVALGSPKMERWADELHRRYSAVYASVGGAVDTAVGVRRAPPRWAPLFSIEWAWRATQDWTLVPRLAKGASAMPRLLSRAVTQRYHRNNHSPT